MKKNSSIQRREGIKAHERGREGKIRLRKEGKNKNKQREGKGSRRRKGKLNKRSLEQRRPWRQDQGTETPHLREGGREGHKGGLGVMWPSITS